MFDIDRIMNMLDCNNRWRKNRNIGYYNPEWGRFINFNNYGGQVGELLSHNGYIIIY